MLENQCGPVTEPFTRNVLQNVCSKTLDFNRVTHAYLSVIPNTGNYKIYTVFI